MSSPEKTKKRFPHNREVYRLCVLLASDIIESICQGKMVTDLTPEFFKAKQFAIKAIMAESGMTKEETGDFLKDFCLNWSLDKVPIFPDQTEDEVSTETNVVAEEVLDMMLVHAAQDFLSNHPK